MKIHYLSYLSKKFNLVPSAFFNSIKASILTFLLLLNIPYSVVLPIILIANMFPFMSGLSSIIFILAFFGLIYRLYQKKTPNFAVVLTILSILLPILIPFFIFALRNK